METKLQLALKSIKMLWGSLSTVVIIMMLHKYFEEVNLAILMRAGNIGWSYVCFRTLRANATV